MDYYQILEINRDADIPTIKKKYKELAQMWHPSLHAENKQEANVKYREITEAYEVLSQAKYRTIYDLYGTTGLKKGAPNEKGEIVGGDYQFVSDPDEVFRDAFGRNPFTEFFDFSGVTPSEANGIFNEFSQMSAPPRKEKAQPVYHDVLCTLEELYLGATKRVEYFKQSLNPDGVTTTKEPQIANLTVVKGMKEGDQIIFPEIGNVSQSEEQGDVIFRIKQKKHPQFKRNGNDLIFTADISLGKALLGSIVKVQTIDGRTLSVPVTQIVHPGYTQVIRGEGMPINYPPTQISHPTPTKSKPKEKGDLILQFHLIFPETLSEDQKKLLKEADL
ncbi:putative Chaperone protein DnaJ [Blattamonas nauphoetae]|uniref:Chaperone protein DnaJ n=1 Tax=Blattamonas nauphoetae TaxID=2049346 RepID=A0ABQ9Y0X7_9EUKA|nr:putative Chaperone protein DnaJ [Blattamonas nauphoetae]